MAGLITADLFDDVSLAWEEQSTLIEMMLRAESWIELSCSVLIFYTFRKDGGSKIRYVHL